MAFPSEVLNISGRVAFSGKLSIIRETLSLTSLVASSTLTPGSNSIFTVERPSSLLDSMVAIPGVPPTISSIF